MMEKHSDTKDALYAILEVRKDANQEEIKAAYRKMVLRYHPDINNKNEETEERVKAINYVDDWQDNESNNLVPR